MVCLFLYNSPLCILSLRSQQSNSKYRHRFDLPYNDSFCAYIHCNTALIRKCKRLHASLCIHVIQYHLRSIPSSDSGRDNKGSAQFADSVSYIPKRLMPPMYQTRVRPPHRKVAPLSPPAFELLHEAVLLFAEFYPPVYLCDRRNNKIQAGVSQPHSLF